MIVDRVARVLVRFYPRAWRARYETELLTLLDDTGASWGASFDIARGASCEWWRVIVTRILAFSASTDRKVLVFRGLTRIVLFPALGVAVAVLAWRLGTNLDARGLVAPESTYRWVFAIRTCVILRALTGQMTLAGRWLNWLGISRGEFWLWVVIDLVAATLDRWMNLGDLRLPGIAHVPQDWELFILSAMNPIFAMSISTKAAIALSIRIREGRPRPNVPTKILDI